MKASLHRQFYNKAMSQLTCDPWYPANLLWMGLNPDFKSPIPSTVVIFQPWQLITGVTHCHNKVTCLRHYFMGATLWFQIKDTAENKLASLEKP